jgi:hypothetical protein
MKIALAQQKGVATVKKFALDVDTHYPAGQ